METRVNLKYFVNGCSYPNDKLANRAKQMKLSKAN